MSGSASSAPEETHFPSVMILLGVLVAAVSVSILRLRYFSRRNELRLCPEGKNNTLLVIAHPDDEAMFFVPTISSLTTNENVHVLCLSNGDYDGLGKTREVELLKSCRHLNVGCPPRPTQIPEERVQIVDDPGLQDGPENVWDVEHVAEFLFPFIANRSIGAVVTFDGYGISGHRNHIAIYTAVLGLRQRGQLPTSIPTYTLSSVPLWRKFIGPLAVLEHDLSAWVYGRSDDRAVVAAATLDLPLVARSLFAHRSQAVWFRWLFILFGRYSFFNELRRLPPTSELGAASG